MCELIIIRNTPVFMVSTRLPTRFLMQVLMILTPPSHWEECGLSLLKFWLKFLEYFWLQIIPIQVEVSNQPLHFLILSGVVGDIMAERRLPGFTHAFLSQQACTNSIGNVIHAASLLSPASRSIGLYLISKHTRLKINHLIIMPKHWMLMV